MLRSPSGNPSASSGGVNSAILHYGLHIPRLVILSETFFV
jgi:hypothetical protein